jgi:hypothetical protein
MFRLHTSHIRVETQLKKTMHNIYGWAEHQKNQTLLHLVTYYHKITVRETVSANFVPPDIVVYQA